MERYLPRIVDGQIRDALASFGAVSIQGPRAAGKTTTGLHLAASSVRIDASPALAALADTSPASVLSGASPRLVDEWQLAPALWNAIRYEVDMRGEPGQFIVTGSATPADDVTRHSGAGRFRRLTLRPLTLTESGESIATVRMTQVLQGESVAGHGGPTVEDHVRAIVRGGWPALVRQPRRSPSEYLTTYLEDVARVDLPGADIRIDPVRMLALVRALARNIATEASAARLSAESDLDFSDGTRRGPSAQSVRKYLDALTRVFVVEEQPAWATHLRSKVRVRVQPKWHFIDPSLAAAALGAGPRDLLVDLKTLGLLFESQCVRDVRVYAEALGGRVYHYRDEAGLEIDIIVELKDGGWAAFEVKLGGGKNIEQAAANLHSLAGKVSRERAAQLLSLNVITAGETSYTRPDGVNVVALGHLTM